ncbi:MULTISPECIES: type II toxin-antitoxin system RelB family antitoxin [Lactiplantibacillus]|uniref:Antitoxin n=1 Tax=Lactiplantibacillus pentosus TaxID=1589 RepID=A0ABD7ITZ1_LACPE|nr:MULTISPECIES: DUF6290 family protein [Lactiplantibacillus]MCC3161725.1 DUF6290 family protein [Lactiplantibacillus pentosus]MCJ8187671.1 DUF6290 family protein [Lactiplantibacillus pentosus]MCM8607464.1 DUF6290 family protein [Lactiplantibacillus sp. B652]PRO96274.1 antitoxin [Lactiplantibacillus pentosus]RMW52774.1 antitoxin [Lactiplantibacillus pentosus]
MAIISVRVSDAEKAWLQQMAIFHGISLSDLIKQYSMDQLEDEYDARVLDQAYQAWLKDDKQTVSMQDVLADFDKPADDE